MEISYKVQFILLVILAILIVLYYGFYKATVFKVSSPSIFTLQKPNLNDILNKDLLKAFEIFKDPKFDSEKHARDIEKFIFDIKKLVRKNPGKIKSIKPDSFNLLDLTNPKNYQAFSRILDSINSFIITGGGESMNPFVTLMDYFNFKKSASTNKYSIPYDVPTFIKQIEPSYIIAPNQINNMATWSDLLEKFLEHFMEEYYKNNATLPIKLYLPTINILKNAGFLTLDQYKPLINLVDQAKEVIDPLIAELNQYTKDSTAIINTLLANYNTTSTQKLNLLPTIKEQDKYPFPNGEEFKYEYLTFIGTKEFGEAGFVLEKKESALWAKISPYEKESRNKISVIADILTGIAVPGDVIENKKAHDEALIVSKINDFGPRDFVFNNLKKNYENRYAIMVEMFPEIDLVNTERVLFQVGVPNHRVDFKIKRNSNKQFLNPNWQNMKAIKKFSDQPGFYIKNFDWDQDLSKIDQTYIDTRIIPNLFKNGLKDAKGNSINYNPDWTIKYPKFDVRLFQIEADKAKTELNNQLAKQNKPLITGGPIDLPYKFSYIYPSETLGKDFDKAKNAFNDMEKFRKELQSLDNDPKNKIQDIQIVKAIKNELSQINNVDVSLFADLTFDNFDKAELNVLNKEEIIHNLKLVVSNNPDIYEPFVLKNKSIKLEGGQLPKTIYFYKNGEVNTSEDTYLNYISDMKIAAKPIVHSIYKNCIESFIYHVKKVDRSIPTLSYYLANAIFYNIKEISGNIIELHNTSDGDHQKYAAIVDKTITEFISNNSECNIPNFKDDFIKNIFNLQPTYLVSPPANMDSGLVDHIVFRDMNKNIVQFKLDGTRDDTFVSTIVPPAIVPVPAVPKIIASTDPFINLNQNREKFHKLDFSSIKSYLNDTTFNAFEPNATQFSQMSFNDKDGLCKITRTIAKKARHGDTECQNYVLDMLRIINYENEPKGI